MEALLEVTSQWHLHHILQVGLDLLNVLTTECPLAEWFTKSTACDTQRRITVLQAVFVQHSNFGDYGVAPRTYSLHSVISIKQESSENNVACNVIHQLMC